MKSNKDKELIIKCLETTPIVYVACQKANISKSTYYRWREEDADFRQKTDQALKEGISTVNDLAESQLITLIKNKNIGSITFWLRHRHAAYSDKNKIFGKEPYEELSEEQLAILKKVLKINDAKNIND